MLNRNELLTQLSSSQNAVIDCHTHAGFDGVNILLGRYPFEQSVKDLVVKMGLNGVNYSVVFPCPSDTFWHDPQKIVKDRVWERNQNSPEAFPFSIANTNLLHEVSLTGENRILPFMSILPTEKESEQISFLEDKAKKDQIYGLKLHTRASQVSALTLNDSLFLPFAKKYNLPILIHTGEDDLSRPENVVSLARTNPDVRFCLAHSAGFEQQVWDDILSDIPPNLFIDTSPLISNCYFARKDQERMKLLECDYSKPSEVINMLIDIFPHGLLWGTDEPWTMVTDDETQTIAISANYAQETQILFALGADSRQQISYANTLKFLGV